MAERRSRLGGGGGDLNHVKLRPGTTALCIHEGLENAFRAPQGLAIGT